MKYTLSLLLTCTLTLTSSAQIINGNFEDWVDTIEVGDPFFYVNDTLQEGIAENWFSTTDWVNSNPIGF